MHARQLVIALLSLLIAVALITVTYSQAPLYGTTTHTTEVPGELSDETFRRLMEDFSETEGSFPSDNFVSNESSFQDVIPKLARRVRTGGAYLGVGPDQNFTYIGTLQPRIAFIIDIRRQNMIQHLMYKALFELSPQRADFLSNLFARPRPTGLGPDSTADEMFAAFENVESDYGMLRTTVNAIKKRLVTDHQLKLTEQDETSLEYILGAFFIEGPNLTYDGFKKRIGPPQSPTYANLLMQPNFEGKNSSYMAAEENFEFIRNLQKKNLIVPVVGDFAGEKAIRSVGEYLRQHELSVTAFYLSNVEQYLFERTAAWDTFYRSVEMLPIDPSAMLIRSAFDRKAFGRWRRRNNRTDCVSLLSPIDELVKAFDLGQITRYEDILNMSQ